MYVYIYTHTSYIVLHMYIYIYLYIYIYHIYHILSEYLCVRHVHVFVIPFCATDFLIAFSDQDLGSWSFTPSHLGSWKIGE